MKKIYSTKKYKLNLLLNILLILQLLCFTGCMASGEDILVDIAVENSKNRVIQDSTLNIIIEKTIYKSIKCSITNITQENIFIDFDYCTFVNQKNYTYQILSGFTTFAKIEDAQRTIVIPPGAKYYAVMLPKEFTYWEKGQYISEPIFEIVKKGDKCYVNIAYRIGEKTASVNYIKIPLKIIKIRDAGYEDE